MLLCSIASLPSWAQTENATHATTTSQVTVPKAEQQHLELLEFLGEWQTEDGEWIDPESLQSDSSNTDQSETNE